MCTQILKKLFSITKRGYYNVLWRPKTWPMAAKMSITIAKSLRVEVVITYFLKLYHVSRNHVDVRKDVGRIVFTKSWEVGGKYAIK